MVETYRLCQKALAADDPIILWMFIVFWDTGSHIFQSDPNNNSDSTKSDSNKSDPNCSSRVRSISGGISKKSGSV